MTVEEEEAVQEELWELQTLVVSTKCNGIVFLAYQTQEDEKHPKLPSVPTSEISTAGDISFTSAGVVTLIWLKEPAVERPTKNKAERVALEA
jgi:hypothetical protein